MTTIEKIVVDAYLFRMVRFMCVHEAGGTLVADGKTEVLFAFYINLFC